MKTSAKSQVLADFIIELSREDPAVTKVEGAWTLKVDGASSKKGDE